MFTFTNVLCFSVERGPGLEGTPVHTRAPSSCGVFQQFRGPCGLLCTWEPPARTGVEFGGRYSRRTDPRPTSSASKRLPGVSALPSGTLPPWHPYRSLPLQGTEPDGTGCQPRCSRAGWWVATKIFQFIPITIIVSSFIRFDIFFKENSTNGDQKESDLGDPEILSLDEYDAI